MSLDSEFVLKALLRYNYLPEQKKNGEQIPPIFTSRKFTPSAARAVAGVNARPHGEGWDWVEYKATRFTGVPRILSMPHPLAHARLCLCIEKHWDKLKFIAGNTRSMTRPRKHRDGRLFVMDYEGFASKSSRHARATFARKHVVQTDIANFFPSIYAHAVPWAAVGMGEAKKNKRNASIWYNELDTHLRHTKRNETQGVAIGPGTSNVMAELILARVDKILEERGFDFYRWIDDYTAFCNHREQADEFLDLLSGELRKYKLLLSNVKTLHFPLPIASSDSWVTQLSLAAPRTMVISPHQALTYLNMAIDLSRQFPDGSVIKYAVKAILAKRLTPDRDRSVALCVLGLAFHHPVLLPVIDKFLSMEVSRGLDCQMHLCKIAEENLNSKRSDGVCWALYFMGRFGLPVDDNLADRIIDWKDCSSLIALYMVGTAKHRQQVLRFAKSIDTSEYYQLDQYWLLLHELHFAGKMKNPYRDERAFPTLKENGVTFLRKAIA